MGTSSGLMEKYAQATERVVTLTGTDIRVGVKGLSVLEFAALKKSIPALVPQENVNGKDEGSWLSDYKPMIAACTFHKSLEDGTESARITATQEEAEVDGNALPFDMLAQGHVIEIMGAINEACGMATPAADAARGALREG